MIGTGVFTTTGYLVADLGSGPAVLLLWIIGGVAALCGALSYAELTAALPRNGGDYHLLSRIFHPALGFTAGWISLVVGFAAPVAAAAIAFGSYLNPLLPQPIPPQLAGIVLVVALSALHARDVDRGAATQNAFTVPKVVLVAVFALALLLFGDGGRATAGAPLGRAVLSPAFAVGLVFVSYSYSGWNGAAYLAGEIREPQRNLPRALIGGTLLVTMLYVLLNAGILAAAPPEELAGTVEVGFVAASALFGDTAGKLVSALIAVGLISAVGAMIMAGPRIYSTMGEDYPRLGWLARRTQRGGPAAAVLLQGTFSVAMMWRAGFDALLTYVGMTLSLISGLTVAGVVVLRWREPSLPRPYRTWLYPLPPLVFIALSGWMITYAILARPVVAGWGAATVGSGLVLYLMARR